jgi:hypothetical protein
MQSETVTFDRHSSSCPPVLHVDYRMAMPRLLAFYLPRVLVPHSRKIEDAIKKRSSE